MRRFVALLVGLAVLLLPGEAMAHHRDDDRFYMVDSGSCVHSEWSADPDDRRVDLAGNLNANAVSTLPNPEKLVAIWRLYGTSIHDPDNYTLLRKVRDTQPHVFTVLDIHSEYTLEHDWQANASLLRLTVEVRWYFDGQVVRHRHKVVEWVPRTSGEEVHGCLGGSNVSE